MGSSGVALAVVLEGEEEDGEGDARDDALVDPQALGVNVALCVAEEEGVEEAVAPPSKEAEGEPEALLPAISLGVGDTVELAHEEGAALELPSAEEEVWEGVVLPVGASGVGEMDGEDDCDTVSDEEALVSGEGEAEEVGVEESVAGKVASDVALGREEVEGEEGMLVEGVKEGDGDCERLVEEVRVPPPPPAIVAVAWWGLGEDEALGSFGEGEVVPLDLSGLAVPIKGLGVEVGDAPPVAEAGGEEEEEAVSAEDAVPDAVPRTVAVGAAGLSVGFTVTEETGVSEGVGDGVPLPWGVAVGRGGDGVPLELTVELPVGAVDRD